MSDDTLVRLRQAQIITVDRIHQALNLLCFQNGTMVEAPELRCEYPKLCGRVSCTFPRYYYGAFPAGFTARVLIELGYPVDLLKALDCEFEEGEVLHPGVKIGRSRNMALTRIVEPGIRLLTFVQDHQKIGWSWNDIVLRAFRPRRTVKLVDQRRRPWLY